MILFSAQVRRIKLGTMTNRGGYVMQSKTNPLLLCTLLFASHTWAQSAWPQDSRNPGLAIDTIPMPAQYMTMGLGFLSDGRLVLATAGIEGGGQIPPTDPNSAIWIVGGVTGKMTGLTVKKVADMWHQPAGVVVVDDKVYVSERDGFYSVTDIANPTDLARNRIRIVAWPTPDAGLSWGWAGEQWHQWVHTPAYFNGRFYGPYGGSIQPGGRSATPPTSTYSGAFISWTADGKGGLTKIAGGLRVPNGMGQGSNGQFFVTDNQGSWLPACTFALMKPGKFFGHRQTPETKNDSGRVTGTNAPNWAESLPYEPATAWLVDGVHQSVSQPLYLDKGPYAGDFIVGDNNAPGLSRIALDQIAEGQYNSALLFFTGGFGSAAINRLALHPKEDAIVVGTFLAQGDWPGGGEKPLYRISFANAASAFEIRSLRSRQGGVEIILSQPVNAATAAPSNFTLSQWHYSRTETYGCCIDQKTAPTVAAVLVSDDKKRIFLAINGGGAAQDRELKIVVAGLKAEGGASLFHNTAYFTHNHQGTQAFQPGTVGLAQERSVRTSLRGPVRREAVAGGWRVHVSLSGTYTVSLRSLDGALLAERKGSGLQAFDFAGRGAARGLCLLTVATPDGSAERYSEALLF